MQDIVYVTAPFFALVLCGYLAARQKVLPESAIPGLNGFVLYFALPCMLFRFGASTLLNDVLMQLEKERTGAYQGGDYFSKD